MFQLTCTNWAMSSFPSGCEAFTVPLFQKTDDGRLIYVGMFDIIRKKKNLDLYL